MAAIDKIILIHVLLLLAKSIAAQQELCKKYNDSSTQRYTMFCGLEHDLTEIPLEIDPSVEVFILIGSELQYYEKIVRMGNMFKNLPNLVELKISYTSIPFIPVKAFEKSTKLIKLDLSNNQIANFDNRAFTNLLNLKELNLSNNKIGSDILASYTFSFLTQLEILDLSNNQIYEFRDKVLFNLTNLIELNLSGNNLVSLRHDAIFNNLTNLRFLNISNNSLNKLDNKLLDKIPNLQVLDLSRNSLANINENHFENLTIISYLDLSFNQLKVLDDSVFNSLTLNYLDLSHNQLKDVSRTAFRDLSCLNLNLSFNLNLNITQLKLALDGANNLENLDLSSTNINDNDLSNDSNELPFQKQAYYLKKLNLSNNLLTKVPRMPEFRKIQELDFSNNQIKSLNQVDLNIPGIFEKLKTHQTFIYFQQNAFSCYKCDLDSLLNFNQFNRKCLDYDYYCLKCYEPDNLKNYDIRNLNVTDLTSCDPLMQLARAYKSAKLDFSYILISIISAVVVLVFLTLFFIYKYKTICSGVYYIGNGSYKGGPTYLKSTNRHRLNDEFTKKGNETVDLEKDNLINNKINIQNDNLKNNEINIQNDNLKNKNCKTNLLEDKNFRDVDLKEEINLNERISVSSLVNNFNQIILNESSKLKETNLKDSNDKLNNDYKSKTVAFEQISSVSSFDKGTNISKSTPVAYVPKFYDSYLV